jgi:hypothetical protein
MPRSTTNFDTVRKIGLALPGVEESTAYGSPALKVHGKLLQDTKPNRKKLMSLVHTEQQP